MDPSVEKLLQTEKNVQVRILMFGYGNQVRDLLKQHRGYKYLLVHS